MKRPVLLATCLLLATPLAALAQDRIEWIRDPQRAVSIARQHMRPIMVYCLAGSRDRDNDIERDQRRSLQNPRVLRLARNFVPLRLSRSGNRDVLDDFGLPQHANMMMSFVGPDGYKYDTLSAGGVAQPDSLAAKLAGVYKAHLKRLYEKEVKPALEDENAKPQELERALRMVGEFGMDIADGAVIKLLDRERLPANVRKLDYEVLAALSTKPAVEKLIDLGWKGDVQAAGVLDKCTPAGAEYMLPELKPDAEHFPYPIYEAVTKICRIDSTKPERWWEKADARMKQEEIDRVKKIVETISKRWKEEYAIG